MKLRVLVHLLLAVTTPLVRATKVAVGATGSQRRRVLAGGAATAKLREGLQLKAAGSYAAAAELIWEAIMTGVPDVPGAFAQYQACYALQGKLEWAFIDVARQATEMGHALTSALCECGGVGDPCASCAARRVAENSPERELCDKEGEGGRAGEGGGHIEMY